MWCKTPYDCWRIECKYIHHKHRPPGPQNRICNNDSKCYIQDCKFAHPRMHKDKINILESNIELQKNELNIKNSLLESKDSEINELNIKNSLLESKNAKLEVDIKFKDNELKTSNLSLESNDNKFKDKDNEINELKAKILDYEKRFANISNIINYSSSRKRARIDDEETEVEDELPPVKQTPIPIISYQKVQPSSNYQSSVTQIKLPFKCPTCGETHKPGQIFCRTDL